MNREPVSGSKPEDLGETSASQSLRRSADVSKVQFSDNEWFVTSLSRWLQTYVWHALCYQRLDQVALPYHMLAFLQLAQLVERLW